MAAANPTPIVSVVIPAYNSAPFLPEAIDSALAQDYPAQEIIVCNDASTDDTEAVLARYGDRIRVVRHPVNRGLSATRNTAIAAARGEFIALLDADDAWLAGKTRAQVEALLAQPRAAICHTATELFGSEHGDGPMAEDVRRRIDGLCYDELFRRNGVCVSSVMMRREALPDGGFFEDMRQAEDYAMWLAVLYDRPAVYLPMLTTRYRRHADQMTADKGKRVQINAGMGRLRSLDRHRTKMPPELHARLRQWALDELHTCTMSRYYHRDFATARRGFEVLRQYGRPAALRHRARAWAGERLGI